MGRKGASEMKWIAGVTLGVMVGLAVGVTTAHATFYGFLTAAKMGPLSEGFKAGYVAGAYDMLSIVVSDGDEGTMSWTSREQYYKKTLACLDAHGDTTGQLSAWAQSAWLADSAQHPNYNAASVMMADACGNE